MTRISTVQKQFRAGLVVLSALACILSVSSPAGARPWKTTPQGVAQDYAQILDMRGQGEIVLVVWMSPPMLGAPPQAQQLMDKYVVIGVVHGRMGPGGSMLFDVIDTLEAKDGNGTALKLLEGDKRPDDISQFVLAMGGTMKQAIGAMGQGMRFFVFENGGVHACTKGKLAIPYASEAYTYETPIPGCPAN